MSRLLIVVMLLLSMVSGSRIRRGPGITYRCGKGRTPDESQHRLDVHSGLFGILHAGRIRDGRSRFHHGPKNAVNILMKNLMDFSVGTIAFFFVGFGLMFGKTNGFCGTTLFALGGVEPGMDWNWTFLIFQTVFAATAATIVSGAMAERTKFV